MRLIRLYRIVFLCIIFLLPAIYVYAGCINGNCENGYGTKTWPDGRKYVGEFKYDKRNGLGTLTGPDGDRYVGEFKDGKANGQGTYTFPDGEKYVGEWKDGKHNGQGTLTEPDGRKYVGEFKDNKRNGQCTLTFPDGAKFVGEYKDDKANGQGTFTEPDGQKYVVEFKDGKANEQATFTYPDGAKIMEAKLYSEVKTIPENAYEKNYEMYSELVKLNPNKSLYKTKMNYYKNKMESARRESSYSSSNVDSIPDISGPAVISFCEAACAMAGEGRDCVYACTHD